MAQGGMTIGAKVWIAAGLIALAGCNEPAKAPPPMAPVAQPSPEPSPLPPPPRPVHNNDVCGALPLQYLVGKPRTDIPVPVNPSLRRVVCSTCMITQDYIAARQTITYDEKSGLVLSVRCG
jgi:hypothetical protein